MWTQVRNNERFIYVRFGGLRPSQFEDLLNQLKQLIPFEARTYHPAFREWKIDLDYVERLNYLFEKFGHTNVRLVFLVQQEREKTRRETMDETVARVLKAMVA